MTDNFLKMKKFFLSFFALVSILFFILNLNFDQVKFDSKRDPLILSTVGMLDDIVTYLLPSDFDTQLLLPSGTDPHVYVPTLKDVSLLNSSSVIFAIGLDLEAQMHDALVSLSKTKPVIFTGERLDKSNLIAEGDNLYDPHIWFDLDLFAQIVDVIELELVTEFPDVKDYVSTRAVLYKQMLSDLDQEAQTKLSKIDSTQKILVTTHDAFSYFARKYNFEVLTLKGINTASDYSLKDKQSVVDIISKNNLKSVFIEDSVSNKDLLSVINSLNSIGYNVSIGGSLFADSLGLSGSEFSSFEATFRSNVDTIFNSLK